MVQGILFLFLFSPALVQFMFIGVAILTLILYRTNFKNCPTRRQVDGFGGQSTTVFLFEKYGGHKGLTRGFHAWFLP